MADETRERAKMVLVQIDAKLLKQVDATAKKRGLTRAQLVAVCLKAMLAKRGA